MTTGPWLEVGPLPLLDLSIQLDHKGEGPVLFWAVGQNGDILCRVGVTKTNPKVYSVIQNCHVFLYCDFSIHRL